MRAIVCSLVLLVALPLTGCGRLGESGEGAQPAGRGPSVEVFGSAAKIRPDGAVTGTGRALLYAARNEFESFQIAINGPLRGLRVAMRAPFVGPDGALIGGERVTIYRVDYHDVRRPSDPEGEPGRWPDALVPTVDPLFLEDRSAFPIAVPAGENRVAWVDIHMPPDATPGTYRGAIEVRADGFSASVPLELVVLDFAMPSTTTLRAAFGMGDEVCAPLGLDDCRADPWHAASVRALFVHAALDNRVGIARPHTARITPATPEGLAGFRDHLLPFLHGTAPTRLEGARLTAFQVNQPWDRNIAPWEQEASEQGFADRAFVWSCDEPLFFPLWGDPAYNWPFCREALESDAGAWEAAPRLVTTQLETVEAHGMGELIDLLAVNLEFLHGPEDSPWAAGDQRPLYDRFLAREDRPRELWLYSNCASHGCTRNDDPYTRGWAGGYQIDGRAARVRALPWLAFVHRADGLLYYDTVFQLASAWEDQHHHDGNGEGTLFYPGTPDRIGGSTPIPIESMRLKHLRDGFEDYELLYFLAQNGLEAEARRIAEDLFPAPWDTSRTDEEVQAARRELLRLVAAVTGGPSP